MDLTHLPPLRVTTTSVFLALACALPASAQKAQTRTFDPHALDFSYVEPNLADGLEGGVLQKVNAPLHNALTDAGARLGRVLFYDTRLSKNESTSCASCHKQENAFADPRALSRGFKGKSTKRNSMSLANVGYYESGRFFWDERGATLEEMVLMPIQDEIEMGLGVQEAVGRLADDAGYRWLFREAYGSSEVTADRMAFALAQFLRSMTSFHSRFDQGLALAGSVEKDFPNFTAAENLGKKLFLGTETGRKATSCADCHMTDLRPEKADKKLVFPVLLQGKAPTNNGVDRTTIKSDPGFGTVSGQPQDVGKFKAPSLRNIELTGPYMHDGRFRSLEKVIAHYSNGIQTHPNLDERLTAGGGWRGRRGRGDGVRTTVTLPSAALTQPTAPRMTPTTPGGPVMGPQPDVASPPISTGPLVRITGRNRNGRADNSAGFSFSRGEQKAMLAFLKTLTDETFVTDPKFADPFQ